MDINLTTVPSGLRYSDTYGNWLNIFKAIAEAPVDEVVRVTKPPISWFPLLRYLNCEITSFQRYFKPLDSILAHSYLLLPWDKIDRTGIEVLCGFRPELVDALWKCDREWITTHKIDLPLQKEFIVTCNGSFDRQEIKHYETILAHYRPTKKKVCLVPCAADKPYPAPLHARILEMLPPDYYLMIGTGVLGLVPHALWYLMPQYDSGIPNQWRLMTKVRDYFTQFPHDRVVVYHDFYSQAIKYGFDLVEQNNPNLGITQPRQLTFVNPVMEYKNYLDLMDPSLLEALRVSLV